MRFASIERWRRSSSARFALIFLLLYGIAATALVLFVYDRAIDHFNAQADEWLSRETRLIPAETPRAKAIERVMRHNRADLNHLRPFGLYDADGGWLAGDPRSITVLPVAGRAFDIGEQTQRGAVTLRVMTKRLAGGDWFVAAQDLHEPRALASDLVIAIVSGGLILLIVGLSGSVILAYRQEARVRRLTASLHDIIGGQLDARLVPSARGDELDELTLEVNRTLAEIHRLVLEVKAAGDNIAHDMRTPLTRLLATLRHVETHTASPATMAAVIGEAAEDVSAIIATFNAILRISEISESARRQCFQPMDLAKVVGDAADFHEAAAVERGLVIRRGLPVSMSFEGDPDLIFEAVGNLVDNAIKYTTAGGEIAIGLAAGPVLTVSDTGPGIPAGERDKVVTRFHRVEASRPLPGNGLGLALVAAIARLHHLELTIGDGQPGCVATLAAA